MATTEGPNHPPMLCPICGRELSEVGDRLIVVYYQPKNYWVTYHLKMGDLKKDTAHVGGMVFPGWRNHCGRADIARVTH